MPLCSCILSAAGHVGQCRVDFCCILLAFLCFADRACNSCTHAGTERVRQGQMGSCCFLFALVLHTKKGCSSCKGCCWRTCWARPGWLLLLVRAVTLCSKSDKQPACEGTIAGSAGWLFSWARCPPGIECLHSRSCPGAAACTCCGWQSCRASLAAARLLFIAPTACAAVLQARWVVPCAARDCVRQQATLCRAPRRSVDTDDIHVIGFDRCGRWHPEEPGRPSMCWVH